jgi:hypothetical protein
VNSKIAVVLDESLPAGLALNAAVHLGVQLGTLCPQLRGREATDLAGGLHLGLPICANVILRAPVARLQAVVDGARDAGLLMVDFPQAGFETTTDEEFGTCIRSSGSDTLMYRAVALYGDSPAVNRITRNLQLWR